MTRMLNDTLLLDARAGWHTGWAEPTIETNGTMQLRRQPSSIRPLVDASGSFGGLTNPGGLAIDADGRIYILTDDGTRIRRFDPCAGLFETLKCVGGRGSAPRQLDGAHGLDISCRGDLFVADTANRRVQVFSLKGLALRAIWTRPEWEPWDIVVARDGRAFVTDRANGLVHRFDCHGVWRAAYGGFMKPTHIAIDRQCRLYVIQEGSDAVAVLDQNGNLLDPIKRADEAADRFCPTGVAVDPSGNVCISDASGLLFVADADGSAHGDARACRVSAATKIQAGGLVFDPAGDPIVADAERQRICTMDANAAYETSGMFFSDALDSRLYNCQWHRVLLRGSLVAGTRVRIDTFTSESLRPIDEIRALPEARWATRQLDTTVGDREWDCLIASPPGRYLWLRIVFTGNGAATPALDNIRAFFPRSSSLKFLPAVYSEDSVSRDFLGRFLSIFDTVRATVSDRIDDFESYFDPASTPSESPSPYVADFLSWLASWIGLALERHWPEAKRRLLVKNAHKLYALRGTPEGLRLHIELYTGSSPRILEHYRLRRWTFLGDSRLGDCSALFGASIVKRLQLGVYDRIGQFRLIDSGDPLHDPFLVYAHQFTVVVPALRGEDADLQRRTLERIIEMAKPAHAQGGLQVTEGRLRIGIQSFVGVDTIISDYPQGVVEGERRLGFDAVLSPSEDEATPPAMRVGVRTRIGATTLLR